MYMFSIMDICIFKFNIRRILIDMKRLLGNVLACFILIGLFFVGSVTVSAADDYQSIKNFPNIIKVPERGVEPLPSENSYTPKFSKEESKAKPTTKDEHVTMQIQTEAEFGDSSFRGKVAVFSREDASQQNQNTGSVLYTNMGRFQNKVVNIRLSFKSNAKKVALCLDEKNALGVYHVTGSSQAGEEVKSDVEYEFLDDNLQPIKVSGNWTYFALNRLKKVSFEKNQYDRYLILNQANYHYKEENGLLTLTNTDASSVIANGDESYLTVTFNERSRLKTTMEGVSGQKTFGVLYNAKSLGKVSSHAIYADGRIIRGQNRSRDMLLYTIEQRVPHVDPNAYFSSYEIKGTFDNRLKIKSENIEIVNDLGEVKNDLFNISVSADNELLIQAKKSGERITNKAFYDRLYRIRIKGKTGDEDKKKELNLPHQFELSIDGERYLSNSSAVKFDPTTEGSLDFKVKRTDQVLSFENVVANAAMIDKVKYKMIEFKLPKNVEIVKKKVGENEVIDLPNQWYQMNKSDEEEGNDATITFGMKQNNSARTIEDFLKKVTFKDKNPKGNLQDATIEIVLYADLYTSREDEEGVRHYYKFIDRSDRNNSYTWFHAYNDARQQKYRGMRGYLATLTSYEEHRFVYENIAKDSGYVGGSRLLHKNSKERITDDIVLSTNINDYTFTDPSANKWYWTSGPEAGKVFFNYTSYKDYHKDPRPESEKDVGYQGFSNPSNTKYTHNDPPGERPPSTDPNIAEPNNTSSQEYITQFAYMGKWLNDMPYNNFRDATMKGIFVEFSQYGNEIEEDDDETEILAFAKAKVPASIQQTFIEKGTNESVKADKWYDGGILIGDKVTLTTEEIPYYELVEPTERQQTVTTQSKKVIDVYQPKKYTLTYDLNGGEATGPTTQTFTIKDANFKLLTGQGITKKGYVLKGWSTSKSASDGTKYTLGQAVHPKDLPTTLKLYANWELNEVKMEVSYWVKNKKNQLEPLKEVEHPDEPKSSETLSVQVGQPIMNVLQPYISSQITDYTYVEAKLKDGTALPDNVPNKDFEVALIYRGNLNLKVPAKLSFVSQKILATKQEKIPLTKNEKVEVINTQGLDSEWTLGVKLSSPMTSEASKRLLGQMYYKETALAPAKFINSEQTTTLKTQTTATINNQLQLFSTDQSVGLYLDVFTGNLKGKYENGTLTWELQNVE